MPIPGFSRNLKDERIHHGEHGEKKFSFPQSGLKIRVIREIRG